MASKDLMNSPALLQNHETESVTITNGGETSSATAGAAPAGSAGGDVGTAVAGSAPANVPAATDFDPSGAPIQIVSDVDPSHPAVDDNPRKGTSIDQNRIDFNDPTISGQEAVEKALGYSSADTSTKDQDAK